MYTQYMYKNHKPKKIYTCNPSRLEFSHKSLVKDKEKAEKYQKKSGQGRLLDEMSGRKLEDQRDQPEELQREDETQNVNIEDDQEHVMIKSWYSWKAG